MNCKVIKQAVENSFSNFLGKTTKPFVYLALTMPGKNIDVNVHPTKLEVQFLHEDKVVEMTPTKSEKAPSILMKENETSEKKSNVKFDESKNSIVEFCKNEKLSKDKQITPMKFKKDDLESPLKRWCHQHFGSNRQTILTHLRCRNHCQLKYD